MFAGIILATGGAALLCAGGSPPLVTDDPGTPGHGRWEINVGAGTVHRPGVRVSELPAFELIYGLGEALQVDFVLPMLAQKEAERPRVSGPGNYALGVKWCFPGRGEGAPTLSVHPQIEFNPPGSASVERGLVERGQSYLLPLQVEKSLGTVTLLAELGREFRSSGDAWIYGAALVRQLNERCAIGAELSGGAASRLDRSSLVVNFALAFDLTARSSLMASVGRELHNHDEPCATLIGYVGWQLRL